MNHLMQWFFCGLVMINRKLNWRENAMFKFEKPWHTQKNVWQISLIGSLAILLFTYWTRHNKALGQLLSNLAFAIF